jgi:hypothetical protein
MNCEKCSKSPEYSRPISPWQVLFARMYGKKLEKFPLPIRNPVPKLVIASFWTREICYTSVHKLSTSCARTACSQFVVTRLKQPCNKSDNFDKVVTSCQQVVPNLLTTCDKQCKYILLITACEQTCNKLVRFYVCSRYISRWFVYRQVRPLNRD